MQVSTRSLTEKEKRQIHKRFGIFAFRRRSLARQDEAEGAAYRYMFEVRRVWNLISCAGPPCCPNSGLIETADEEYVYIESWEFLNAVDMTFPGKWVTTDITPRTGVILSAEVSGDPVEAIEFGSDDVLLEVSMAVKGINEFGTVPAAMLPERVTTVSN